MKITKGDRVRFDVVFLRNTGQYTGPEAPTNYGPFARGRVEAVDEITPTFTLATVRWEDDVTTQVRIDNLERIAQ